MAASINSLTLLPPELLQRVLTYAGNPAINSLVSKNINAQTDQVTKSELRQIWQHLHPGQPIPPDINLEAVKAIYHDIFQQVPKDTAVHFPIASLERFEEAIKIKDTLTFWRELPGGRVHVAQQDFRGLSSVDIRARVSTWIDANPAARGTQTLNLGNKNLRYLPPEIVQLANLQILDLSGNQLTELPPAIVQLANLQALDLSGNQITELPPAIIQLANLLRLLFLGNQLTEWPDTLANSPLSLLLSPHTENFISAASAYRFFNLSIDQKNAVYGCIYTLAIASEVVVQPCDHEYGKHHVFDSEERLVEAIDEALRAYP